MRNAKLLSPLTTPEPARPMIVAASIKTDELGEFESADIIRENDSQITRVHSRHEFMNYVQQHKNRSARWYAHNGENADFTYLLPEFMEMIKEPGVTIKPLARQQGASVIGWVIKDENNKRSYQLRDSYAVLPSPIEEVRNTYAPQMPVNVTSLRDSLIAFSGQLLDYFSVNMQWSAAGTALRAWRRTISNQFSRQRREIEDYSRNAYYGGLTYLRSIDPQFGVTELDFSGMYAWSMLQGVPSGPGSYVGSYYPGVPGIYRVRVNCPRSTKMAYIAKRYDNYGIRWPTGKFETWCTSIEIEHASKRGYTFDIQDGIIFRELIFPFTNFIQKCQSLEIPNKGTPLGHTTKLLRCSLYGRFGMRREREDYILSLERPEGYTPCIVFSTGEIRDGLYMREEETDKPEMMPHWAAWITANARLRLVELHEVLGYDEVFYSDTDSVYAPTEKIEKAIAEGKIEIGKNYGQLKRGPDYRMFHASAPKSYYAEKADGSSIGRSKGIPASAFQPSDAKRAASGERVTVDYTARNSPLTILRDGLPASERATRSYSRMVGSSGWTVDNGAVRPIHLED